MEQKSTILAMYSGGLDSLGMLYLLFTNPKYTNYNIHIHHVHNMNMENRHKAEAIAVKIALDELRNLEFKFVYSESKIGVPTYNNHFLFDTDSMNFFAGYIASVNPDIKQIAMGMNADDSNESLTERRIRANNILSAFTSATKIYPVFEMTKRQLYDSLPSSLKDKFWSCRRPIYTETSIAMCGICKTCKTLKEFDIR